MLKRGGDIGTTIYDGAAEYGRFMAWVGLIIGMFISAALAVIGLWLLLSKEKYSQITTATVKEAECKTVISDKSMITNCLLKITYTVDSKLYEKTYGAQGRNYFVGETFTIRYNPENPDDYSTNIGRRWIGWILIGVGLVVAGLSLFSWWIAMKFQFAAAATGVGSAYGIITDGRP